jgi:argonaute-like protein implicated in RNA metabolism and viral defense
MPQALKKGEVQPNYNALLWNPPTPIDQTPLLFGSGFVGKAGEVMKGLNATNGGVYHRHPQYQARPIKVAVLKLYRVQLNRFLSYLESSLERCGFQSHFVIGKLVVPNEQGATSRVDLQKALDEIAALAPDLVLVFLPQSDRHAEKSGSGSPHPFVELHLLRRQIASQFIYTDTFHQLHSWQIMHQIVPGILAKVGNLPFILAESLAVADCFIGLDISYSPQPGLAGSSEACANIRLYGKQGEFIRYRLEELRLEGEEIPHRFWERLLPSADLAGKTALIYREERFCGNEVSSLLQWAKALQANFILIECVKSSVTQLDSSSETLLEPMNLGLAFRLSPVEAILAITKVCPDAGLPGALVLRVHQHGHPAPVEQVLDATQKLTLLHHGALKTPHLPMPLHGTERMAYLKLNGIYPSFIEGDRQFWL